jgi:hypothetical protein
MKKEKSKWNGLDIEDLEKEEGKEGRKEGRERTTKNTQ